MPEPDLQGAMLKIYSKSIFTLKVTIKETHFLNREDTAKRALLVFY